METANERGHPKRGRWFYLKPSKWVKIYNSVRWPRRAMKIIGLSVAVVVFLFLIIDAEKDIDLIKKVMQIPTVVFAITTMMTGVEGKTLFHKKLGERLKMFREAKRISQIELAQACGYNSTGTISQIEMGISGMEVSKLMKAAVFLGVHPAALLTELNLTDEQLKQLSKFAMLIQHPEKAKNLDAILTLLKTVEV